MDETYLEATKKSLEIVEKRANDAVDAMMFSGGALDMHLKHVLVYIAALEAKVRELATILDGDGSTRRD
jgi:hypothetical protein